MPITIRLYLLLAFSLSVFAQTAELSGFIKDPQNAAVPKAALEVRNEGTGAVTRATTNSEGIYTISGLNPGRYDATVQAQGFKTTTRDGIALEVAQRARLDITLEVGSVEEKITVTSDATLLNATDASVGTVTNRTFVENLPMNGRSFQSLIYLTPGTVPTKSSYQSLGQFSVNGQRSDANYFTVDGVGAAAGIGGGNGLVQTAGGAIAATTTLGGMNNLVSVDALQEFRIQTSTFAPEYGRTPGAQVQIITRSGTNEYHGVAADYFRNTILDANDWFANSKRLARAPLQQNDFDFVLGGPLRVPHLYNGRNRTFFFVSYEGLRLLQPLTSLTSVPTLATRQNAAAALQPSLNAYPLPNGADLGNGLAQFNASYSNPTNLDAGSIRIDQMVGSKLTLFGRYNQSPSQSKLRGAGGAYALSDIEAVRSATYTATVGGDWIVSPALTDEFRVNYSRNDGSSYLYLDSFGGATVPPDSAIFPAGYSSANSATYFGIASGTQSTWDKAYNANNSQQQVNLVDTVSYVHGAHEMKFGGDYRRLQPTFRPYIYQLQVQFNTVPLLLAGTAGTVNVISDNPQAALLFNQFSAFAQDTWKVTRRFTLTYGARWDVNPAPSGDGNPGLVAVTNFTTPSAIALAPAGAPAWQTTWDNFAPRAGIAYQVSQRSGRELVLRGGFGVFYDPGNQQAGNPVGAGGFPFGARNSFSNVPYPLTAAQFVPPQVSRSNVSGTFYVFDPNLKLPRSLEWNVALEQAIGAAQKFSVTYIGASGHNLLRTQEFYPYNINDPNFPNAAAFILIDNGGNSNYQALQLQFQRRLSRGLQGLVSYSWSHSIDNLSTDSPGFYYTPQNQPDFNRASSDFDVRQSVSGALTYNIPVPAGSNAFVRQLLGGWAADAIFIARTPTPVNILVGTDLLSTGSTSVARPNLVAGVPLYLYNSNFPGGMQFNRAAFSTPAAGQQGNLGRNAMRGFNVGNLDFGVRRQFRLAERATLQVKGEIFNLLNHPNFADPINSLSNASFGLSTSMYGTSLGSGGLTGGFSPLYQIGGPRLGQLALKVTF
jgi:hypothetical protein